ncbi:hypothetical protein DFH94DRAFT_848526 [Russula ochroleuca]|uniref:Uncharacterized protein n=1 Tax=Russula ochroleuca TaxID=152965 RepID=A0A9P5MPW2_9AGAM|nr:hypothetical protein DFH94DRAFT_848526 [Russula ochroleuca]
MNLLSTLSASSLSPGLGAGVQLELGGKLLSTRHAGYRQAPSSQGRRSRAPHTCGIHASDSGKGRTRPHAVNARVGQGYAGPGKMREEPYPVALRSRRIGERREGLVSIAKCQMNSWFDAIMMMRAELDRVFEVMKRNASFNDALLDRISQILDRRTWTTSTTTTTATGARTHHAATDANRWQERAWGHQCGGGGIGGEVGGGWCHGLGWMCLMCSGFGRRWTLEVVDNEGGGPGPGGNLYGEGTTADVLVVRGVLQCCISVVISASTIITSAVARGSGAAAESTGVFNGKQEVLGGRMCGALRKE